MSTFEKSMCIFSNERALCIPIYGSLFCARLMTEMAVSPGLWRSYYSRGVRVLPSVFILCHPLKHAALSTPLSCS